MGWLELLRLIAEDQNRASAEANRKFIEQLAENMLHNNLIFSLAFVVLSGLVIFLILTYNSHRNKIKHLEDSIGKESQK